MRIKITASSDKNIDNIGQIVAEMIRQKTGREANVNVRHNQNQQYITSPQMLNNIRRRDIFNG